jgi:ketosteroid isomerase-like protein
MAHPNEDLVRRAYDAFSQGDIETLRQLFPATPHHVYVVPASSPEVAAAPNCCSRSLPNARRRTPSRSPLTSPSAAGPRPSPTHAFAGPEVEIAGELVGPIPRGTFASGDWRRDSGMSSIGSEGSGRGA